MRDRIELAVMSALITAILWIVLATIAFSIIVPNRGRDAGIHPPVDGVSGDAVSEWARRYGNPSTTPTNQNAKGQDKAQDFETWFKSISQGSTTTAEPSSFARELDKRFPAEPLAVDPLAGMPGDILKLTMGALVAWSATLIYPSVRRRLARDFGMSIDAIAVAPSVAPVTKERRRLFRMTPQRRRVLIVSGWVAASAAAIVLYLCFRPGRFKVLSNNGRSLKVDELTGQTWREYNGAWVPIVNSN